MTTPGGLLITGVDIRQPLTHITFSGFHGVKQSQTIGYWADQSIEIDEAKEVPDMAQRVNIEVLSDLSDEPNAATLSFGLDGHGYEIDLTEKEAEKFRKLMAPYVGKGRKVGRPTRKATANGSGPSPAAIREWAQQNTDLEVPDRGRIPEAVREAYRAAHA